MEKKIHYYHPMQLIRFRKLHASNFFKLIVQRGEDEAINLSVEEVQSLSKERPAIVLRVFRPKNSNLKADVDDNLYLVAPLTTKRSIENWGGTRTSVRIKIKSEKLKDGQSFICLDDLRLLTRNEILGTYGNSRRSVELGGNQKDFLKNQIEAKLGHICRPFSKEESIELNQLEETQEE